MHKLLAAVIICCATAHSTGIASAQAEPDLRVFERIEVEGNSRFRDGDILATADLRTGESYSEEDLLAAVDALEFTAEFRTVRIFSNGPVLTISDDEEPEYSGALTFGLGFESGTGLFGSVGLALDDALGNGSTVRANLTYADEFTHATASVSNPSFWGGDRAGGVRAAYSAYDYDDALFGYNSASISPYLSFDVGDQGTGEVRITALRTEIDDVDPGASPIIQAEAGDRTLYGPGVSFVFGGPRDAARGWAVRIDQDFLFGDAEISRTELRFSARTPLMGKTRLRTRIEIGGVTGLGGNDTTAADRFTLGGASMRGFSRGGISPRDVCLGCGGGGEDLVTDLGGNYYAVARTELVLPFFEKQPMIEPFLFADVGSVWSVESDTLPAGTLADDQEWRSSAGVGVAIGTPLGRFAVTYAPHIDGAPYDDEAEFNLIFTSEF